MRALIWLYKTAQLSVDQRQPLRKEFEQVYDQWKSGEITAVKAIQEIGVKKTTFYKLVRKYEGSSK
ncbi:hypothetical protein LAV79_28715 [Peribacillus butanolivorans]|uniref:hypothetical protein n=1 Tax=Peribacillus butanolivorans TaxID=421767 RepID=UPI0030C9D886